MTKQNFKDNPGYARFTARASFVPSARAHKYKVGEIVTLARSVSVTRPKAAQSELPAARFEITRLLPEQEKSFHYRLKDAVTGQERVAAEDSIVETTS